MKENWKELKLGEIAKVQTGPFGSQLHSSDYVEHGTPLVTVKNLGKRRINRENLDGVSEKDKKRLKKYMLKKGDIVFSRVGVNIDRSSLVTVDEDGWIFSSSTLRARPNLDKIYPDFLIYYLNSQKFKNYIRTVAVGATRPSLNTSILSNSPLIIPPLEEQKTIASILSALDDKIENNLQMNKTLEEMAMALYKYWFVDFGPFQDGEFVDSELGEIPKGWKVKKFGDIVEKYIDNRGKTSPVVEYGIPLIEVKHISTNLFPDLAVKKYVDDKTYDTWFRSHLEKNDIIISTVGTVGLTSLVPKNEKLCIAQNLLGIRFDNKKYPRSFMFYLMKNSYFINAIENRLVITVQKSIKRKDLNTIPILIPSLESIHEYSLRVDEYLNKIELNITENKTLVQLRDTLLPKLVSGEVRIKNVEKTLSEVL